MSCCHAEMVRRYLAGVPIKQIHGNKSTLYKVLRRNGITPSRNPKVIGTAAEGEIVRQYLDGVPCKMIGSTCNTINIALSHAGVARNRHRGMKS